MSWLFVQPPLALLECARNPRKQKIFSFAGKWYFIYFILLLLFIYFWPLQQIPIPNPSEHFFERIRHANKQTDKSKLYANIHIELSEYRSFSNNQKNNQKSVCPIFKVRHEHTLKSNVDRIERSHLREISQK